MSDNSGEAPDLDFAVVDEVFCDTNIALNFVQIELEGDRTSDLVTDPETSIVIGETVDEELDTVCERRVKLYEGFLDFVLEQEGEVVDYSPSVDLSGQSNDQQAIRSLKMELASEDTTDVCRFLRRLTRQVEARVRLFREKHVEDVVPVTTPFTLGLALGDVIPNSDDCTVVEEAVTNAREGGGNVLVTMDNDDLLSRAEDINAVLADTLDSSIRLRIIKPATLLD